MTIKIDGKVCEFENGQTILQVAKNNSIKIPTLCYMKDVLKEGNCRICMVELGNGKLVPSCATKASDGMEVSTNSEKVIQSRKNTLNLILSDHFKNCSTCPKTTKCDLQKLFIEYGVTEENNEGKRFIKHISDTSYMK